jgi:peptidoglycan hydrolase-like protein with peptidoglycan-binding domain
MTIKKIATAALMASVALSPISPLSVPARADGKDFIAGAIIGGLIGGAVANENNKKRTTKTTRSTKTKSSKPSISAEQREANREVQTALNYFGYNVGTPDGSIGPKSRAAITEYQAFLGYPGTGQLSEHERTILVTSYHRAVAGGPIIAQTVSGSVLGLKAVLIAQRDEMAGIAPVGTLAAAGTAPAVPAPGSVGAAALAALPTLVPAEPVAEVAPVAPAAPVVEEVAAVEEPALPSFMDPAGAKGSLATECSQIEMTTTANGGLTTADSMQDANFALGEQFCLARNFAISKGDELTAQIAGFSPDQIAEQCAAFGPVLKDHVAALSLKPATEVLAGVEGFILTSGMTPAQLSGTAKVCLGVGYVQDDMNVAIGSALLLAAMGERGYSEYLGHHLSQGFGATERPDLAMDWYQMSLDAMGQGQTVVAPGIEGRDAVIKKASYTINGRAGELEPEVEVQEAALPVFEVAPEAEAGVDTAALPEAEVPLAMPETDVVALAPEAVSAEPGPSGEIMNSGMQAAITAARLPLMIFSSN